VSLDCRAAYIYDIIVVILNSIINAKVIQIFNRIQGKYGKSIEDVLIVDFNSQDQRS
jgi:hypothetical protein